jgi:hypothetical protein
MNQILYYQLIINSANHIVFQSPMKYLLFILALVAFVHSATTACGSSTAVLEAHEENFNVGVKHCVLPNGPYCSFSCTRLGIVYHYNVEFQTGSSQEIGQFSQNAWGAFSNCGSFCRCGHLV